MRGCHHMIATKLFTGFHDAEAQHALAQSRTWFREARYFRPCACGLGLGKTLGSISKQGNYRFKKTSEGELTCAARHDAFLYHTANAGI